MKTADRNRALSRAVHDFAAECGRLRTIAATLHVGVPRGEELVIALESWYDAAMRADLLERALSALDTPEPLVWHTRPGACRPGEADNRWCAATLTAASRVGRTIPFYIITRRAWLNPVTEESRTWTRIRSRPPVPS